MPRIKRHHVFMMLGVPLTVAISLTLGFLLAQVATSTSTEIPLIITGYAIFALFFIKTLKDSIKSKREKRAAHITGENCEETGTEK